MSAKFVPVHPCLMCGVLTKNPKVCSRSCQALYAVRMRPSPATLPVEPLLERLHAALATAHDYPLAGPGARLERLLGVNRRRYHRWRHNGLTVSAADEVCVAADINPVEVWGDEWFAPEAYDRHTPAV